MEERKVSGIAHSYWRVIKRGDRTFESVKGDKMKEDVKYLAYHDVLNGVITAEEYEYYIGVPFEE